ncbi:MAG: methionine synthase [Candidatus Omnitrophica bacterium]|nr:methionine synthase [Candidatus Omnitrophota bacterium]
MSCPFLDAIKEKVVVLDGAMGTNIQRLKLRPEDYGHKDGCNEYLAITKPAVIRDIHNGFLEAGCDAIETNTFGAASITLAEYGLQDRTFEINEKAARLAREAADAYSSESKPRFVLGSIGPGTKLPSLGHIHFDQLLPVYQEQIDGLIQGGVDALIIETCQDLLQAKIAVLAAEECFKKKNKRLPVMVQVTFEQTGSMLLGTEMSAVIQSLEMLPVITLGMNCATGPQEMADPLRFLCDNSTKPISAVPNAGLPENIGGVAHYKLTPKEFADYHERFVKEFGVNIVGGCCGTTADHLREVVNRVRSLKPKKRAPIFQPGCASLYTSVSFQQEPPPLLIGEQTNANGSRKFKQILERNDYDNLISVAREAVKEGAHMIDVCVALTGRDEIKDMHETIFRFQQQITAPLVIDSTEPPAIEAALKLIGGKTMINSINLEDGEKRLEAICPLAKKYGAALIALTIDEEGMAKTKDKKFEIAKRIFDLTTQKYGISPEDIFFDTLTFTLGSGDPEFYGAAIETLEAIKLIKSKIPGARTILGVSNISFGLSPLARQTVNSVFLNEAIQAGLDAAIVHAKRILPPYKINPAALELAKNLIHNKRTSQRDPLLELIKHFDAVQSKTLSPGEKKETLCPEDGLKNKIIDGDAQGLEKLLEEARKKYSPLEIINNLLLVAMKTVGELFGAGKMQLPFVLKSAEVMKKAVSHLEPYMDKISGKEKGTMVLATVKGDVHDIGKNLVDIILTNNGYRVINLGIKQPIDVILKAAEEHKADAIGLSGLLVKSTLVMKQDLEEMNDRNITLPVICGGAALTKKYVEDDLAGLYRGNVFYGQDAFSGLRIMDQITDPDWNEKATKTIRVRGKKMEGILESTKAPRVFSNMVHRDPVPKPPFWGYQILKNIRLEDVYPWINKIALFKGQWQFRQGNTSKTDYEKLLKEKVEPLFEELKRKCIKEKILEPRVIYGFYPCLSEGNSLIILDESKKKEIIRFEFPRQKKSPYLSIPDFFRSKDSGKPDVVAFQIVTIGPRASEFSREKFSKDQYSEYFHLHGLSVETAEALAEYVHFLIRRDLGIHTLDQASKEEIFKQGYQGSRYSFGYPACPNLEDQKKLFQILPAEKIGVSLTEEFQLVPEQSTSAIVVYHPQAKYFTV